MFIDFHTHIFPDKIAQRVIRILKGNAQKQGHVEQRSFADGTLGGLRASMERCKISKSVALPIATKPTQADSINSFAMEVNSPDVISFGSVHPMQSDWEDVIDRLYESGIKGIKLHPQYQQVRVDSPETIRVLKKAESLKMYTTLHAGVDIGVPPPLMCTPKMLSDVLTEVSGEYIIAAHLGGFDMWDEVEKELVGKPIYFDTAVISSFIEKEQYKRIVKNHGSKKVLFASDLPWEDPLDTIRGLDSLGLSTEEYEDIAYKNAKRILGI